MAFRPVRDVARLANNGIRKALSVVRLPYYDSTVRYRILGEVRSAQGSIRFCAGTQNDSTDRYVGSDSQSSLARMTENRVILFYNAGKLILRSFPMRASQ